MILRGRHRTEYRFANPVALASHLLRLQPRQGSGQILRRFELSVDPTPAARSEFFDAEGNATYATWFLGQTQQLTVETSFEVETTCVNPFDYIPDNAATSLPPLLDSAEQALFSPSLTRADSDPAIAQTAQRLAVACDGTVSGYVQTASLWLYRNLAVAPRRTGAPRPASETLSRRQGACRDLAVLLMEFCRVLGIPARFVSGYQEAAEPGEQSDLHAWVEAWIPGGGWRGFDPTQGLVVADRHVVLATSALPALAAPVIGSFYGNTTSPVPIHRLELETL